MNFWERNTDGNDASDKSRANNNASQNGQNNQNNQNFSNNANTNAFSGAGLNANMEEKLNRYSSMSEQQLMSELVSSANRMKSNGSFSAAELEGFIDKCAPYLNAEQLARMRTLVDMIK